MAVSWPVGEAKTIALSATGAQAITIDNMKTIIDGVTVEATGNRTINLTVDSGIKSGAQIQLRNKTNGTETTTFGTGITDGVNTGVAGKTFSGSYTYDGTTFTPDGELQQQD